MQRYRCSGVASILSEPAHTRKWFQAGTAQKKKFVAVHEISLSAQHIESLPAFHAITGCDTVSQLSSNGKKTARKVFQENTKLLDKLGKKS